jgi:hypothetical protein
VFNQSLLSSLKLGQSVRILMRVSLTSVHLKGCFLFCLLGVSSLKPFFGEADSLLLDLGFNVLAKQRREEEQPSVPELRLTFCFDNGFKHALPD